MNTYGPHFLKLIAITALMMCGAHSVSAQVTVNTMVLTFKAGQRPVQTVMVGNSSPNAAYVLARVEKVLDPETGGNKAAPSDDILISPKTFSVESKGQRAIRLLMRQSDPEKETVYRALFVPQDRGFGQEIKKEAQGRKASIRVLTGMGVLMFVEPKNPRKDFNWTRTEDEIVFTNNGNVHVELADGKSCDGKGENCTVIEGKRVYAGTNFAIKVPDTRRVTFLSRLGSASEFAPIAIDPAKQE